MNVLRVFLSSPSGLQDERKMTKEIVDRIIPQSVRSVGLLNSLVGRIAFPDTVDHKPRSTRMSMSAISSWVSFGTAGDRQPATSRPDLKKSSSE